MTNLNVGRLLPLRIMACTAMIALFQTVSGADWAEAADCRSSPQSGIDWSGCKKSMLLLTESRLDGANLSKADLNFTNFRSSSLKSADLEKARMVRTSFALANLEGANLARVEAYRSNFATSVADGAKFVGAEVQRADFRKARLRGTDFTKAELGRADFRWSDITGSRFTMANLARARLSEATFTGPLDFQNAFMLLTRIEGVDLSAATGLDQAQINLACGDKDTRLPAGLVVPSNWPCPDDPDDGNDAD